MTNDVVPLFERRRLVGGLAACGLYGALGSTSALAQTTLLVPGAAAGETVTVTGQKTPIVTLQTWIDLYGRPTAQVLLNGRGPYKFVVDTGSNTTVLSTRVARALNLEPLPDQLVYGVTGTALSKFGRLGRIETGRSSAQNLSVAILDTPTLEALDGILGMDMFRDRRIRFNFTRKTVEFEQPGRGPRRLPIRASVRLRQGLLIETEGRIGSVRARCVIDTGSDTSIINYALLNAIRSPSVLRRRNAVPPQIIGVTNQQINGVWASLPPVELIGLQVSRLVVIAADAPVFRLWGLDQTPAMIVGMDILSRVETLVIDYRRREVELQMLSNLVGRVTGTYQG